jgi:crossover junction endodeoxyribonuclease RuvC
MKTSNERIVMGIDPGYAILGYAVVAASGNDSNMLACGVITTPAGLVLPERLQQIYQRLSALVDEYRPQEAAMEELFFGRNVTTAIAVGHARGVAMLALVNAGIALSEYKPSEVKLAVTGCGAAKKGQVGEMVRLLLHLQTIPRPDDAADAAAIAICHLHTARYQNWPLPVGGRE